MQLPLYAVLEIWDHLKRNPSATQTELKQCLNTVALVTVIDEIIHTIKTVAKHFFPDLVSTHPLLKTLPCLV